MFYDNTLNLKQELGGSKIKQGDFGSVLSFILLDGNGSYIDELNQKTASISLCTDDKILYVTTATINNSTVEFKIDKAIPAGVYYVEIKVDNYIFPSDRSTIISIEQGATVYDLKDLIPNYDVSTTLTDILNKLNVKDGQVVDLQNKMNAIYSNALSDHAEILTARGGQSSLDSRLDAIEAKEASDYLDLNTKTTTNASNIALTNSRLNGIIANAGNGTVPSELTDIRIGYDGTSYSTAGEAMREQFRGINYILEQVVFQGKNIFDTSNALAGCYISDRTGTVTVNESFSSYYFPVDATQKLSFNSVFVDSRITWVSSSQDMSKYSVGDVINGFISAIANTAVQNVIPPAGAVGVVVSIPTAKATLAQVEYGSVSTAYEPYKIGIYSDKILGFEASNLTVGPGKMYATIQSAVDASNDGDTITIYPGTYREAVDARTKLVNLVGVSKKLCILEYPNGAYSKPPLEIAKGSVTNLTIRATAQTKISDEVAKAYAVHIDFEQQFGYDLKFENVHFINEDYQTLGIGLRNNSSLEFVNCVIESSNHNAFYCHSQPNSTAGAGQNLLVKNCTIINNSSSFCTIKMQSQPYESAVAIATFQGNIVVNRGSAKLVEMILYGNHSDVSHNGWLGSTEWQLGIASATNNVDILNI
ncbi:hypothetical protein [Streptococcus uberis]|uniref:hypothetical protein n=1 Tax=Streptococcus uberis TaxID=1349 RepID=UPI00193AB613|nr:hypothetical protein [Streptococcus uberis]